MRIGLITGEYPPMQGGVGAYTRVLAQTFADQGHEVFILTNVAAQEDDPRLHLTNEIGKWNMRGLRKTRQWAQQHNLDVVSLQFETAAYGMSPWVHFLPELLGEMPVVTTFHDLLVPYLFPKAGKVRDWIVRRLAEASAGVVVTNHEDMRRLQHLPNARLIPIGSNIRLDTPANFDRREWRDKLNLPDDSYLLAYFGFINQSKGVETLLHALGKLRTGGLAVELVMIGGKTGSSDPANIAYAERIDMLIENMRLTPFVHWTGFVSDEEVSGYLHASDVVVLPFRDGASYRRGSLMAAIQHGCAIVTTRPQVDIPNFEDGENMLLVPPEKSNAIVKAVKHLITNDALRYQIILGATALNADFEWDNIAQEYLPVFEAALQQS